MVIRCSLALFIAVWEQKMQDVIRNVLAKSVWEQKIQDTIRNFLAKAALQQYRIHGQNNDVLVLLRRFCELETKLA